MNWFLNKNIRSNTGLAKKFILFFPCKTDLNSTQLSLTSLETIFRLYFNSSHISVQLFKKASKLVNFCVAILILKMEVKSNIFGILCFIILRKINTQLKHTKKDFWSVWRRWKNMFINLGSGFIVFIGASTSDFQFGKILSYAFQAPQCWLRDDDKCKKL